MNKFTAAAVFTLIAAGAFADPIEGVWQTQPDGGAFAHVRISPCGDAFCGMITRSFKGKAEIKSPNTGKKIVIDMVPQGDGNYTGKVLRPADNKIYNGKAKVRGSSMSLSGCVAGGLICKSQTWTKTK